MNNLFCYKIFHTENNDKLRNHSYSQVSEVMNNIDSIDSDTYFLKTKVDCLEFIKNNKKFKINTIKNYTGENTIFPPRSGVVGIIASNYMAWKSFLKTDKEFLILFEDDITLSNNIEHLLPLYINELPEDWDVFSFYIPNDVRYLYNSQQHDLEGKQFICKSYTNYSCAAYIINKKGAEKAIKDIESNGISAPVDWYVLNVKHLGSEPNIFNVYCLKPNTYMPVKEIPEASFLTSTHNGKTEEFDINAIFS